MKHAHYDFDPSGSVYACCDGPDLLVYSGEDVPMWKLTLEGFPVGVHAARQRIAVVDSEGRFVSFLAHDGTRVVDQRLDFDVVATAGAHDGRIAASGATGTVLLTPDGDVTNLPVQGAVSLAFGGVSEGLLAAVWPSGRMVVLSAVQGTVVAEVQLEERLLHVSWSSLGQWVVASVSRLALLDGLSPGALTVTRRVDVGGPVEGLAVADDGVCAAVIIGQQSISLYEVMEGMPVGSIQLHRTVAAVSFGAGTMLGIGLEDGESNRANLSMGGSWRSPQAFGRGQQNWPIQIDVDQDSLRTVLVAARSGGQPVARMSAAPVSAEDGEKGNGCLIVIAVVFGTATLCGLCTGFAGFLWALFG